MRQRIIESSRQKAAKTTGLVRWRINAGPNPYVLVSLLQNSPRRLTNFSTFRTLTFNLPWTCSWCTPPNSLVTPFWAAHRRRNFSVLRMILFDFTDNRRQNSGRRCPIWRDLKTRSEGSRESTSYSENNRCNFWKSMESRWNDREMARKLELARHWKFRSSLIVSPESFTVSYLFLTFLLRRINENYWNCLKHRVNIA